jgi:hypothetical protein
MMKRLHVMTLASIFILSGCASAIDRDTQSIKVVTEGVEGAYCRLSNAYHAYQTYTPGVLKIERDRTPLNVTCTASGFYESSITVKPHINNQTYWNILNAGVGAVYDGYSGSMFEYPTMISVPMTRVVAQAPNVPMNVRIAPLKETAAPEEEETLLEMPEPAVETKEADVIFNQSSGKSR